MVICMFRRHNNNPLDEKVEILLQVLKYDYSIVGISFIQQN